MKNGFLFILCFFVGQWTFSQIVNIEKERYQTDTTGWKGSFDAGIALSKQAKQVFILSASAHVQYKSKRHLYLILGSYDWIKSKEESFVHSGFVHFRFNYKMKKDWIRWEAFTQVQFNKANGLKMRFLVGTGPRFKIMNFKYYKCYVGTLYFFEREKSIKSSDILNQIRFGGYLSFTLHPKKYMEWISTTYYQPLVNNIHDYRIASENKLVFRFTKLFSMGISFKANYDTRPPKGAVANLTYEFKNNFTLDF